MSDDEQQEADMAKLKVAVATLSEHFDTVQIFVTRVELDEQHGGERGTRSVAWGSGNWFARAGHVQEWLLRQDERTRKDVRSEE